MSKPFHVRVLGGKSEAEIKEDNEAFARVEEIQKKKALEDNAANMKRVEAENSPLFKYVRAVKHRFHQHKELAEIRNKPREELQAIYTEFIDLSQRRGLPLSNEDQDFGRLYLENLLSQPQRPPPADPKNLLQRMKNAVTSSPKM